MLHKITIPIFHEEVNPRFDLASEVLFLIVSKGNVIEEERTVVLPRPSGDELCHLLISENINTLICGAIEDEYHQFLKWKKIEIYDGIAGTWSDAFQKWKEKTLKSGDILSGRRLEGIDV
jgi:predicted Fe-Mo cluster-binding NifX family protein